MVLRWLVRILTSANSAATKKPFSSTSAAIASSLPSNTIGGSQYCTIVSAIGARARGNIAKFICTIPDAPDLRVAKRCGYNLPTRFGYARDQPLRSQFAKSQTRHLEPTNERAPAAADFTAVHHARRTRVTRQLRQAGVVLFRL